MVMIWANLACYFGIYGMYTYGYVYLWVCIPMGMYTYGMYTYGMCTYGMYTYGIPGVYREYTGSIPGVYREYTGSFFI